HDSPGTSRLPKASFPRSIVDVEHGGEVDRGRAAVDRGEMPFDSLACGVQPIDGHRLRRACRLTRESARRLTVELVQAADMGQRAGHRADKAIMCLIDEVEDEGRRLVTG